MKPLDENPDERRAFDYGVEIHEGNPIAWMAVMAANWAAIERMQHPCGSFGEQLAIMANELSRAAQHRAALEIIAGVRPALDNLMGNADIARAALATNSADAA